MKLRRLFFVILLSCSQWSVSASSSEAQTLLNIGRDRNNQEVFLDTEIQTNPTNSSQKTFLLYIGGYWNESVVDCRNPQRWLLTKIYLTPERFVPYNELMTIPPNSVGNAVNQVVCPK